MQNFWRKWHALNPPVRWLIYFILIVITLSLVFAPEPRKVNYEEVNFATISSSRMYFKNVRSYYYDINPREKAPFILYRFKRRLDDSLAYHLPFMIIENPFAEEAYIYAEQEYAIAELKNPAVSVEAASQIHNLKEINNEQHLQLAAQVYNSLLSDEQIWLLDGRDTIAELYEDKVARSNAEMVLEDYFKLTNKN